MKIKFKFKFIYSVSHWLIGMKTYIQYIQYVQSVWINTLGELMYKYIQSNIFNNTVYMITLVICDRIGIMYNGEMRISRSIV